MHQFSIRDIENLSGIKAHTLRAWEQRYAICKTERHDGQHRVYNNDELKTWLRITLLYNQGHRISVIAAMKEEEQQNLIREEESADEADQVFIHRLTEASLDFNKDLFEKVLHSVILRNGLEYCIRNIIYPYLQRIGMLWLTNHALPAQEHFASHIIRKKIILATDGLESANEFKCRILLFTPSGEFHEIPLLIARYFLKKAGLNTVYFGTNVSAESLASYLKLHKTDYLYTHVITFLCENNPETYMASIHQHFKGKIIRSGPGIRFTVPDTSKEVIIHSLDELIKLSEKLGAGEVI